eukprot:jgi/Astpho2/8740/gw1.00128.106.1_t
MSTAVTATFWATLLMSSQTWVTSSRLDSFMTSALQQ